VAQRGISPGFADVESIQGWVLPIWVLFVSSISLLTWLMLSFHTLQSYSRPGGLPSLVRESQRDTVRADVSHATADTKGKQKVSWVEKR